MHTQQFICLEQIKLLEVFKQPTSQTNNTTQLAKHQTKQKRHIFSNENYGSQILCRFPNTFFNHFVFPRRILHSSCHPPPHHRLPGRGLPRHRFSSPHLLRNFPPPVPRDPLKQYRNRRCLSSFRSRHSTWSSRQWCTSCFLSTEQSAYFWRCRTGSLETSAKEEGRGKMR